MLTQNCHNIKYPSLMIISERHLFKGLTSESDLNPSDELFHRGHALAVSVIASIAVVAAIGTLFLIG